MARPKNAETLDDIVSGVPDSIRSLPSWLLGRAAHRGRQLARAELSPSGLGLLEHLVMASLVEQGGHSQAELTRELQIDGSDMVAILTTLETLEFVERRVDPEDARRKLVAITPKGRQAKGRVDGLLERANEALLVTLSPDERASFVAMLQRVVFDR